MRIDKKYPDRKFFTQYLMYKDGALYWLPRIEINPSDITWNKRFANKVAGYKKQTGHISIGINRRQYQAHRIIYLMHHDYLPPEIDHINRKSGDNRIENLREATRSQNRRNSEYSTGKSKYKGVHHAGTSNKWVCQIVVDSKKVNVGQYDTELEAAHAYNLAVTKHYGEFAVLNDFSHVLELLKKDFYQALIDADWPNTDEVLFDSPLTGKTYKDLIEAFGKEMLRTALEEK